MEKAKRRQKRNGIFTGLRRLHGCASGCIRQGQLLKNSQEQPRGAAWPRTKDNCGFRLFYERAKNIFARVDFETIYCSLNSMIGAEPGKKHPVGRGSEINPPNRFEKIHLEPDPDNPASLGEEEHVSPRTQFFEDSSESILTHNKSPDVGFEVGLNAYRGCEHGCAYCFARPFHEYLGFSSGLDFETKIMVKLRAPELLKKELSAPKWKPQVVMMSGVTDCYQPAERH